MSYSKTKPVLPMYIIYNGYMYNGPMEKLWISYADIMEVHNLPNEQCRLPDSTLFEPHPYDVKVFPSTPLGLAQKCMQMNLKKMEEEHAQKNNLPIVLDTSVLDDDLGFGLGV